MKSYVLYCYKNHNACTPNGLAMSVLIYTNGLKSLQSILSVNIPYVLEVEVNLQTRH